MGWKCIECENTGEKWGLCRRCWAYYMHPSNTATEDETSALANRT